MHKIDHQNKIGEIGYWLTYVQGKGITTSACEALLSFCFNELQLNRIEIKCGTKIFEVRPFQ
ncbi:MAG: GNAT family N-acetyltransferase [Saprospiraceae bacterium]|nr:GNAT family N-acetyltransferase [Saprospiraceae bacterium]